MKKILIIHDRFQYKGGGERLCLIMAQALNADILTEYWDEKNSFSKSEAPGKIFTLGKRFNLRGLGYVSAQLRFFFKTKFIKNYDVIIFSGNNCLSAAWRARSPLLSPPLRLIMYCHTPVRYAYDLKDYYYQKYPWYARPIFLFFVWLARIIYQWGISKMDIVLANSQNVQARLQKFCGVKSEVVYPPIDLEKFGNQSASQSLGGQGDYYLSFGRLVDLKRVDDIVRAFHLIPDPSDKHGASKKLVIASGGPELAKIKQLAAGHSNIEVLGFVSDETLAKLVQHCIANIYIPRQEDFGMTPLEAAAAGKPTIGVDDGGLRETIIHQKTGYLIPKNYEIEDLVKAVAWLNFERAAAMASACRAQAKRFSKERFVREILKQVDR
jgi:glycosyltransferase involved in cell wall biosynthesis